MLTPTQVSTLTAALLADANALPVLNSSNADTLLNYCNAITTFQVWNTATLVSNISDAITWANFTPGNPASGAGQDFLNWCAQCAIKRDNLWVLLTSNSNGFVNTGKHNIQAGLQDALTGIPSGVSGANRAGGWPAVQLVIQRPATYLEKVLATGVGTAVSPGDLSFEGLGDRAELYNIVWNIFGVRKF